MKKNKNDGVAGAILFWAQVILLILKIAGQISCTWFYTFTPLWLFLAVVVVYVIAYIAYAEKGADNEPE